MLLSRPFSPNQSKLYLWQRGLWRFRDRLCVPYSARSKLLTSFQDSPAAGHQGVSRMLSTLTRTYSWPLVRQKVITFCSMCDYCQQTKISTQGCAGELVPLPNHDRPWSVMGIDFIIKLPSYSGHDSIFFITYHLTIGTNFIPCNEEMDSHALALLFVKDFFWLHRFPDKIVSDRGPSFVSAFWRSVMTALRISPALSTASHPETDGQTERNKQTLETYIWHFTCHWQDYWADWLPMAGFAFNNSTSASTRMTHFF